MDLHLEGRVAVVTGSSRGLGLASAAALVSEGCHVTICARDESRLKEASAGLATLSTKGGRVLPVAADVSMLQGVDAVIARTVAAFGGLDVLVNNVGLARGSTIVETSDADWQEAIDQTLYPAIRASRLAVPHMRRRGGGSIV
jgi:3-oxoacyl-[acyl-carrier protein] reductase